MKFSVFSAFICVVFGASCVMVDATRTVSRNVLSCLSTSSSGTEKSVNISHIQLISENDTLNFVHAAQGAPTVLIARTLSQANVNVNCSAYLSGNDSVSRSVTIEPEPVVSMALSFTKLIQFDDDDKKSSNLSEIATMNSSWIKAYSLSSETWTLRVLDDLTVELKDNGNILGLTQPNSTSSVSFKFYMHTMDGFFPERPNLEYRDNVTLVEVTLDNLSTHSTNSRFAVEMVLTKSAHVGNEMDITQSFSIDDEISPGSFSVFNWKIDGSQQSHNEPAYLRWRPSCFTDKKRSVQQIVKTNSYQLLTYNVSKEDDKYYGDLTFAFYGADALNASYVHATNVSFGGAGDDPSLYYSATRYSTWMLSFGFGAPPSEHVPLMIILVCSIGLGIPLLLLIVTFVVVIVKRIRRSYSEYTPLSRSSYAEIN